MNAVLCLPQNPKNTFPAHSFLSLCTHSFSVFKSPSRPPTPSYSFPSSLLFSWSLHSTPPLQTAHKRPESATPDLWQTFQSSRPFHTARVPYPSSSISQSMPLVQCYCRETQTNRRAKTIRDSQPDALAVWWGILLQKSSVKFKKNYHV